jgi:light-regulated signal transduction histidine kinase (bacteriophytochrome)
LEKSLAKLTETLDGVSMDADVAEQIDFILKTDVPESLRFVKFGNQQMDMLLGGLMRLSRVGTASVKESALDMYHLFDSVVQGFQFQINTLDIDLSIQEDIPDCIGDYSLMSQVFINLLDNAIKYRHPDRKTVIKMGGSMQDEMAEYTISDNGIGIEPEQQEKVFDLFHQLHSKPDAKGQGLGLTLGPDHRAAYYGPAAGQRRHRFDAGRRHHDLCAAAQGIASRQAVISFQLEYLPQSDSALDFPGADAIL